MLVNTCVKNILVRIHISHLFTVLRGSWSDKKWHISIMSCLNYTFSSCFKKESTHNLLPFPEVFYAIDISENVHYSTSIWYFIVLRYIYNVTVTFLIQITIIFFYWNHLQLKSKLATYMDENLSVYICIYPSGPSLVNSKLRKAACNRALLMGCRSFTWARRGGFIKLA